jgi:hypothetical protein
MLATTGIGQKTRCGEVLHNTVVKDFHPTRQLRDIRWANDYRSWTLGDHRSRKKNGFESNMCLPNIQHI